MITGSQVTQLAANLKQFTIANETLMQNSSGPLDIAKTHSKNTDT